MTPQQVLDQFRREMADDQAPYLWGDDEALLYLAEAQDDMVKAMGGIADAGFVADTDDLCTVSLTEGVAYSAISPYVLRVRSARLVTAARDVHILNESDLPQTKLWSYGQQSIQTLTDEQGPVEYGILGMQEGYIRWVRVPESDDTCRLNVFRLPYPRLTGWNGTTEGALEIVGDHHLHLVTGMRAKAYLKQDSETYDKGQADRFQAAFDMHCNNMRKEYERRRYRPRVVQYGGV